MTLSADQHKWTFLSKYRVVILAVMSLIVIAYLFIVRLLTFNRVWWHGAALWHRCVCAIIGVQVDVIGKVAAGGPVLYASNHISWLDIPVLGGRLPNASFIAKHEISTWGIFGKLANLHKTIYVKRERRTESARQRDALAERVNAGDSLILFPEGTTRLGVKVAAFKSALFAVAERADAVSNHNLQIQPVTLSYTEINGLPMIRNRKIKVGWIGVMPLLPQLKDVLSTPRMKVTIELHPPVHYDDFKNRKDLAAYCQEQSHIGLNRAHRHEYQNGPQ